MGIEFAEREARTSRDTDRKPLAQRIAAAPISWGVCEVPWGYQMPRERVLAEMQQLGVQATEFGPDDYLPLDGAECLAFLETYGLTPIGGFVPVVLHDSNSDPVPAVSQALDRFSATGANVLVLAASTGLEDYDQRPELDDSQWQTLLRHLDTLNQLASERGIIATLHPHLGTMVENGEEVARVLEGSPISLTLDTGHLFAAGTAPMEVVSRYASRVAHLHLKDVDATMAARMRSGEIAYGDAVADGMYVPLGEGDAGIADVVSTLEANGYNGWYVMEQDIILRQEPDGEGPLPGVRRSLEFLNGLSQQ